MGGWIGIGTLGLLALAQDTPRVHVVADAHDGWTRSMAFAPDGRTLVTGGSDAKIRLWDPADARALHTFDARHGP